MKKLNQILIVATLFATFATCSPTNKLTMGVLEPAKVHVPSDVMQVGIINRSLPSKGNETADKIDKILSIEGLQLDEKGAVSAIESLATQLERQGSFEGITILENQEELQKGLGVFPAPLSWNIIESLCQENNIDMIFSLAFYDTDTKASYDAIMMKVPNELGVHVEVPAHEITLNTNISNGWRIYDLRGKQILDEQIFTDRIVSKGKGINPIKAYEAVMGRNEAVVAHSNHMGSAYGIRLKPTKRRVSRDYFVRGTDNFKVAQRRAQAGNWNGAAELWEREVTNPDPKIAGRACYNMAIINEINGKLTEAMDWASKSYTDYGTREALQYLNVLKYRFAQKEILDNQLSR